MSKRHHKAAHKAAGDKDHSAIGDKDHSAKKTVPHEDSHEELQTSDTHDETHSHSAEESNGSHEESGHKVDEDFEKAKEKEKIHLEFFGSDILRAQAPEVMKIADSIADDWVKDGDFDKIPLGNHVAEALVGKGLRKAKEVEKKLEEKGVFLMARMGADYLKSKIKR